MLLFGGEYKKATDIFNGDYVTFRPILKVG